MLFPGLKNDRFLIRCICTPLASFISISNLIGLGMARPEDNSALSLNNYKMQLSTEADDNSKLLATAKLFSLSKPSQTHLN